MTIDLTSYEALSFDCYGVHRAGFAASRRHDRPSWGATPEPSGDCSYDLEFRSMQDFADAVDQAFAGAQGVS